MSVPGCTVHVPLSGGQEGHDPRLVRSSNPVSLPRPGEPQKQRSLPPGVPRAQKGLQNLETRMPLPQCQEVGCAQKATTQPGLWPQREAPFHQLG